MKNLLVISLLALAFLVPSLPAQTQEPAKAPTKLIEFQMALLKKAPKFKTAGPEATTVQHHREYAMSLLKSGRAVIAGPTTDKSDLAGLYIFRTKSGDEAHAWVDADPLVTAGYVIPELHPWWSQDVFKKNEMSPKFETAYLAFLVKGEKWTPEKTPQTEEIQKGHMANISRLAEMKKLVVAGPFGDDGT